MMLRRLAICCLITLLLPALSQAELRVASYNIRNYNQIDRLVERVWRHEYPKPEQEKRALRRAIIDVNPDVIALQEIGSEGYLEELRRDLKKEGLVYPHSAHLLARDDARCLAVLSKVPMAEVHGHDALSYGLDGRNEQVRRGLLEVSFDLEGQRLTLYVVHLKSRRTEDADDPDAARMRVGEARRIRDYIRQKQDLEKDFFLVAGDINDTPDSATLSRFLKAGEQVITLDLKPQDSRGETWTYHHSASETYQRIDVILASTALAEAGQGSLQCRIFDGAGSTEASDHRILFVNLPLNPLKDSWGGTACVCPLCALARLD